jgi:hypothetical protein
VVGKSPTENLNAYPFPGMSRAASPGKIDIPPPPNFTQGEMPGDSFTAPSPIVTPSFGSQMKIDWGDLNPKELSRYPSMNDLASLSGSGIISPRAPSTAGSDHSSFQTANKIPYSDYVNIYYNQLLNTTPAHFTKENIAQYVQEDIGKREIPGTIDIKHIDQSFPRLTPENRNKFKISPEPRETNTVMARLWAENHVGDEDLPIKYAHHKIWEGHYDENFEPITAREVFMFAPYPTEKTKHELYPAHSGQNETYHGHFLGPEGMPSGWTKFKPLSEVMTDEGAIDEKVLKQYIDDNKPAFRLVENQKNHFTFDVSSGGFPGDIRDRVLNEATFRKLYEHAFVWSDGMPKPVQKKLGLIMGVTRAEPASTSKTV